MRARLISVFLVLLMVFTLVPAAVVSNAEPSEAADVVSCTNVRISTSQVRVVCTAAGIIVLDQTINLPPGPTVTLPPLPGATITVHVPGPVETATVRVPVPGPTQSVTATQTLSGPTSTVTVSGPTKSVTANSTQTATVTASESSGQVGNGGATMDPTPVVNDPVISIPNIETPAQAAVVGLGLLALLTAIVLLGLYAGYVLGYKDADKENAGFMKAMISKVKKG
jgi:hypothetical protein